MKNLFGQKTLKKVATNRPLEIYDIKSNSHELLYQPDEKVVMRISGIYGNFEKSEITNAYGVKFHKYSEIF